MPANKPMNKPAEFKPVSLDGNVWHVFYHIFNEQTGEQVSRVCFEGTLPEIIQKVVKAHQDSTNFAFRWKQKAITAGYKENTHASHKK